jgi:hypothetical protein
MGGTSTSSKRKMRTAIPFLLKTEVSISKMELESSNRVCRCFVLILVYFSGSLLIASPVLCLFTRLGAYTTLRNYLRVTSGPLIKFVQHFELGVNSLATFAFVSMLVAVTLFCGACFDRFANIDLRIHFLIATAWFGTGLFLSMAI